MHLASINRDTNPAANGVVMCQEKQVFSFVLEKADDTFIPAGLESHCTEMIIDLGS